jgi:CRP-like cAMP-binding protein
VICREGDEANFLYFVKCGEFEISKNTELLPFTEYEIATDLKECIAMH